MRRTPVLLSSLLVLLAAAPLAAQKFPDDPRLQEGFLAWDRGAYDEALAGYLAVLTGPGGAQHLEEIALLTGELYQVSEVTPEGRSALRVGPTSRYATFETQEAGSWVTRVVDVAGGGRVVATLPVRGVTLTARDEAAYLDAGGRLTLRALPSGPERTVDLQGWTAGAIVAAPDSEALFVVAGQGGQTASDVLRVSGGQVVALPTGAGNKSNLLPAAGGRYLVFTAGGGGGGGGRGGGGGGGGAPSELVVFDLASAQGAAARFAGRSGATLSADGSALAFIGRDGAAYTVEVVALSPAALQAGPVVVTRTTMEVSNPALSPSGAHLAFQGRPVHDWEIYAAPAAADGDVLQITKEIQHDINPRFIDERTVLALKGEGRHRRSYLYDVHTREQTKLFHNNTVRTVAPEYEWQVAPDGRTVLIIADRDGDTISPERGVYLVHLDRKVTLEAVRRRLEEGLAAERDLRERGRRAFAPIAAQVRPVTERVDVGRIYQYAKAVYEMDSKHIAQPGNQLAIAYYEATLRAWGYEPELQWFDTNVGSGANARTIRTANVIARLPGTVNPELVYVVSSHFDSVERGPGADDNSSGSTALLEVARTLKDHPQPATLEFAWFTGEEAGLRGSREYVRRAVADGKHIAGALNNDMIGWTRNHRLDNTIRYSNAGIRDIQHAAAIQFSELITYDAHYYRSTDAAAYYEAYGDIVGGIGSYPILESPHYHQVTDRLENINQRLVAEVARTTVATLMLLASSPARLVDLEQAGGQDAQGGVELSWHPALERGVTRYRVAYLTASGQPAEREVSFTPGAGQARPSVRLENVAPGSTVSVKAINERGLESWDWAHLTLAR